MNETRGNVESVKGGRDWKKVVPGIYLVGPQKVVYFRQMVNGKREFKKSEIQGALAIGANGRPTAQLNKHFLNWKMSRINKDYLDEKEFGTKVPTFGKLIEMYEKYGEMEYAKNGKPGERAREAAIKGFRYLLEKTGHKLEEKADKLTLGQIDNAVAEWLREGKSKPTAKTYAMSAKSITARWALPKYAEEGYCVKEYDMPVMSTMKAERYRKLSDETIAAMDALFEGMWKENMTKKECREWLVMLLVFKFELRPGDTERITIANDDEEHYGRFVEHNGIKYLCYIPNKTRKTSGTHVNWPVHPDYWEKIEKCREILGTDDERPLVTGLRWILEGLTDKIRRIPGLEDTSKAIYEFRKLDMHRTFHKFGAEKVSAKSGDDIKTITYYYADISWVDLDKIDIDELK